MRRPLHREASDRLAPRILFCIRTLLIILLIVITAANDTKTTIMNKEKFGYESPQVEIIEVEVEKGFANSNTGTGEDGNGNELG